MKASSAKAATLMPPERIPRDLPIFLDSPLAVGASEIYLLHPDLYDEEAAAINVLKRGPQHMPSLKIIRTAEESQKINEVAGTATVIAGSGMATAGRILHHLKHNLWRQDCHVVFVGFQAQGTTGRRLVERASEVKIFREPVAVKARLHTIKRLLRPCRPQRVRRVAEAPGK